MSNYFLGLITIVLVAQVISCESATAPRDDPPDISNVDFATQVNPIFSGAGCTNGSCHGGGAGNLSLGSDATTNYNNLVNVASACGSLDLVEPGSPDASQLYKKIAGTQTCGNRMPQGNATYFNSNADKLETVRVWIEEGAKQSVSASVWLRP